MTAKADKDLAAGHSPAERRRYERERVELSGRQFEPADSREATCHVADISLGGARILSDAAPPEGSNIVLYIDGFGRFEGRVVRREQGGFGIQFNCTEYKRERLSEKINNYKNGLPLEETTLRRHRRTPANTTATFTRANGEVVKCDVLDFSLSGLFLATEMRPPIGEFVLLNGMPGRVARHHNLGIAIEFLLHDRAANEPVRRNLFIA